MPRWWGGILLFALLISLASVVDVAAQQPVINACVVKTLGLDLVRIIGATQKCPPGETPIQ